MIALASVLQSESPRRLVGTWRLLSYEARDSKGQVQYPFGEHVTGQLIYDRDGNMSAHVMNSGRPAFASNDPARGTDAEVRAAFEGYVSYFGTYTIDQAKHTVIHHVRGASYPNWIGNNQIRYYRIENNRLVLSTPPLVLNGQSFEYVLAWERMA
jgi:hypothetical protein